MKDKILGVTREEWIAEGERLFGDDMMKWRFVCPSCGNVQSVEEFAKYKDKGATPDSAYFNCIGRYDGHGDADMCSGKSPCNYTSGGLFCISPVSVTHNGKTTHIFAFAEVKK